MLPNNISFNLQDMPRKFRLSVHRKDEFKRERRRTVNVEHVYTVQFSSQSVPSSIFLSVSPSILHLAAQPDSQLSSHSASHLSSGSASQSASHLSSELVSQSASPPAAHLSPWNLDLEKELKVSVPISIGSHQASRHSECFVSPTTWYALIGLIVLLVHISTILSRLDRY